MASFLVANGLAFIAGSIIGDAIRGTAADTWAVVAGSLLFYVAGIAANWHGHRDPWGTNA